MDISLIALEVDGSLANPIVRASMAIWLLVLLVILMPTAVYAGRRARLRLPVAWALAIAAVLVVPTQVARGVIGTLLYRLRNPNIISAGFWGGGSPILIPILAATAWYIIYRMASRRAREVAP